jgi:biopolymer transport protein ExbD
MPGVCLNSLQPDACEWSVGYLWHWMNWIVRLDIIVLALLLAYIVLVATRVSFRYHLARRAKEIDSVSRIGLAAFLRIEVGSLKSIASIAPYLGLAGTCVGIVSAFRPIAMEKHAALAMISAYIATSLITTAAGIFVAVPATCSYNYLCTRIDLIESELPSEPPAQIGRYRQVTRRLALTKQFSQLPAFALIAAPCLAILVAVHAPFSSPRELTGLEVGLVPNRCVNEGDDRLIVLRLSDAGEPFINQTQEDWSRLPEVLSKIYGQRVYRTLYLRADDGVPFQTVADAIDIVENANVEPHQAVRMGADKLNITVRLITPKAMNTSCVLEPVAIASSQHASR